MTPEKTWRYAVKQFEKQGWRYSFRRTESDGGMCLYRGPDGCRCAAGHFISNANYRPNFENKNMHTRLLQKVPLKFNADRETVSDLQHIHDNSALSRHDTEQFKQRMFTYGQDRGWSWPL